MITCVICCQTCYRNYRNITFKDDNALPRCPCFKNYYCTVCKNKCHWSVHKNLKYEFVEYMEEETVTLKDMEAYYYDCKKQLEVTRQLLMYSKSDIIKLNLECISTQQKIMANAIRLKEIALNKTVFESAEEYIDMLIIDEKDLHKEGWQTRVKEMEIVKEHQKKLLEIFQGKSELL